jgi:hypothetical protein
MKSAQKALLVVGLLALLVVAMGAAKAGSSAPPAYSTSVAIEPLGASGFVLKAQVKDVSSGAVLAAPTLKLPSAETGKTETTLDSGETVVLSATLDGGSRTAVYAVTVRRGGRLLAEHSAKVAL